MRGFWAICISLITRSANHKPSLEGSSAKRPYSLKTWKLRVAERLLPGFPTGGIVDLSPNVRPIYILIVPLATGSLCYLRL